MALTGLTVLHTENDHDGTLIFGSDGTERVLALVTRTALDDHFGWPRSRPGEKRPTPRECHLVVYGNLATIEPVIQEKYARGDVSFHMDGGATLKRVTITAADLLRDGQIRLTDTVLDVGRGAGFVPV